jgi:hypothetical protein
MALDYRNYRQVVETTVEHAEKAGVAEIMGRVVNELKDEAEPYRKMVMETITKVVEKLGASDIDEWLEVRLVDFSTVSSTCSRSRRRRTRSCWMGLGRLSTRWGSASSLVSPK